VQPLEQFHVDLHPCVRSRRRARKSSRNRPLNGMLMSAKTRSQDSTRPARTGLESIPAATTTGTCQPVLPAGCAGNGPLPGCRQGTCRRCPRPCRLLHGATRTTVCHYHNLGGPYWHSHITR
jgi:hypothetical protein